MHLRHDEIRQKYGETHFLFVWFEWVNKWKFVTSKMLVFTKLLHCAIYMHNDESVG